MGAAAEKMLQRLERPRTVGPGRWMTACPCCQSRQGRPVSVRELDDGRVLVHAFCGCETGSVLSAIGLEVADLFDRTLNQRLPGHGRFGIAARDALALASHELDAAAVLLSDAAQGRALSPAEMQRLAQAAARVGALKVAARV